MRHYFDLVLYKSYADLRVEAKRGYLGILWWVIEPILYMAVFYFVFGVLLDRGGEGFVYFLLTGLVVWRWFDNTVRISANALTDNIGLMQQVYVPKIVFPSIAVLNNTVKFLIVFSILILFLLISGIKPEPSWLLLPVLLVIQLLFITAAAWFVSAAVTFFSDLRVIIDSGLTLLFFLSGVFFDLNMMPEYVVDVLKLNPMAILIDSFRKVLIQGILPDIAMLGVLALFSTIFLYLGWRIHVRFNRYFPKIGFM